MAHYIDKDALVAEIESLQAITIDEDGNFYTAKAQAEYNVLCMLESFLDTIEAKEVDFMKGSNYAEKNLWKPADGDDLPEFEREVIVLHQPSNLDLEETEYCVSFAHRPNPKGWDGKSIATGKVDHYTPKTYGKGGWNIPDVKWWLDLDFPNES